ncbi:YeeE/YedE thiosulfate transporter family protein, partial [Nostoc sp. NIES-2111]
PMPAPQPLTYGSPILQAPAWATAIVALALVLRITRPFLADRAEGPSIVVRVWTPHAATTVIGITFLVMLLLVGAWAYTDVLAELARGMAGNLPARLILFVALLAGAVLGGWTAGRPASTRVTPSGITRCFLGGFAMACGGMLIPGGNDGLILVGMPLLWPYAWVAFLTMCASIGAARGAGLIFPSKSPSAGSPLGGKP